jgi:hypothetical protein
MSYELGAVELSKLDQAMPRGWQARLSAGRLDDPGVAMEQVDGVRRRPAISPRRSPQWAPTRTNAR